MNWILLLFNFAGTSSSALRRVAVRTSGRRAPCVRNLRDGQNTEGSSGSMSGVLGLLADQFESLRREGGEAEVQIRAYFKRDEVCQQLAVVLRNGVLSAHLWQFGEAEIENLNDFFLSD